MSRPYVLVAPTGARWSCKDHPALPIRTDQIVATARACAAAGADGIHLHFRDDDGQHTPDPGRYRETLDDLMRCVSSMEAQITTEAAGR